jgi:prepilin-type N-terminal cleavage/methylation domain-containing protein
MKAQLVKFAPPQNGRLGAMALPRKEPHQRGFTLVEMMISILIGLFLIGGLLTLVQTMKRTSGIQGGLSQLQDNERMTTGLMADVIQATGDYPNPMANTPSAAFLAWTVPGVPALTFSKSQSIVGTAAAAGDVIAVRYATSGTDGLTSCVGNPSAVAAIFVNVFSIDANGNLQCRLITTNGAGGVLSDVTTTLVNNVTNLQILYGMKTNATSTFTAADAYLTATQVAALAPPPGYTFPWVLIKSVQLTLTLKNPLANQPNQQATLSLMRVVNIMNQVGATT